MAWEITGVAKLKTLMGYAKITAPFDGVITERFVDHGDFVRSAAGGATTPTAHSAPMITGARHNREARCCSWPEVALRRRALRSPLRSRTQSA